MLSECNAKGCGGPSVEGIFKENTELPSKTSQLPDFRHALQAFVPNFTKKYVQTAEAFMSYLRYWKLKGNPFSAPQSFRDIFLAGSVEEALARGDFLVSQRKKLGLVVGPSGVGKSTLLHHLLQSRVFQTTNEHPCLLRLLGQTPFDLTCQALEQLDPDSPVGVGSIEQNVLRISDMVMSLRTVGHHTIVVFDETKAFTEAQLELFARLSRIPGVTSLLSLDEESLVDLPRWLIEQSDLRIDLPPWDLGLVAEYFEFAISAVGGDPEIFDAQSITRIQELAEGIPRRIAQIADLALVSGAVRRKKQVNVEIVEDVCNEFTLTIGSNFPVFWDGQQLNA
ncbi:AAA family ATPase [Pirellulaceae bacterium SH467]